MPEHLADMGAYLDACRPCHDGCVAAAERQLGSRLQPLSVAHDSRLPLGAPQSSI